MRELIAALRAELVDHHDIVDGDSKQLPNWAMRATTLLDEIAELVPKECDDALAHMPSRERLRQMIATIPDDAACEVGSATTERDDDSANGGK